MKHIKLTFLLFALLFSQAIFALRCGHELVDLGDNKEYVFNKCGEPESVDTHIERRGASNFANGSRYFGNRSGQYPGASIAYGQQQYVEVDVLVEEWIYDFGRRRLQQYLRFENGRLKEIKTLGRGD
ncbi:MAG: DUF2845 domain-containing protein [Methylovulum sp.]|uniref:DUF2845 domain-containing protein n=1 Tax=Methylovulum sp. TaxID=1916980 RepID=UPI002631F41E|nr:DUF2845 domain-containing protein [Methylovulum sp.]MDD2723073.1 DUF2845 domain-containing protein [Methylovulum sp.]MDD5123738.1 DUF2845 domain-containing protein [Methylovulum sp.]